MQSSFTKRLVRIHLAVRQNVKAIAFVLAWLVAGFAVLVRTAALSPAEAALVALCVVKGEGLVRLYQAFTEVVVFGIVVSVVVTNVTRKYRPEETCRALAEKASGHVVVIGWTNLGRRVKDLATAGGATTVVVEEDPERVLAMVREEEPLVVGSPRDRAVLEAAGIARAKVVVIATEDLETAAVACRRVRDANASAELVVRCPDEDVGALLARTYRARAISTSRLAAEFVQKVVVKGRARSVVVFGESNVALRVIDAVREKNIAVTHASDAGDPAVRTADVVVLGDDDLGKNLVLVDRVRDVNRQTKIVCRTFHDDSAELLTRAPFECVVLSTSRHAAEALARAGVFREVGIDGPVAQSVPATVAA